MIKIPQPSNEELARKYLHLTTEAYMYPTCGIKPKKFYDFVNHMINQGWVNAEDVDDALDNHPIPLFLAYLLYNDIITRESFIQFIKGTDFGTGIMNYKEFYKELLDIGVKINER